MKRSEQFSEVMVAVDAAKGEAIGLRDANFVRICDEQLFPFLEEEKAAAERREQLRAV